MLTALASEPDQEPKDEVDAVVDDWFDKYDRWLFGSEQVEKLKAELRKIITQKP